MRAHRLMLAAGMAALTLVCACATSNPVRSDASAPSDAPEKRPKLFRTQAGNEVTLQWQSEPGVIYGVIYSTNLNDSRGWRVLPGFDRIPGNGGMQKVTFTAPVPGKAYYRLRQSRGG